MGPPRRLRRQERRGQRLLHHRSLHGLCQRGRDEAGHRDRGASEDVADPDPGKSARRGWRGPSLREPEVRRARTPLQDRVRDERRPKRVLRDKLRHVHLSDRRGAAAARGHRQHGSLLDRRQLLGGRGRMGQGLRGRHADQCMGRQRRRVRRRGQQARDGDILRRWGQPRWRRTRKAGAGDHQRVADQPHRH